MKNRYLIIATSIYPPDVGGPAVYFASLKEALEVRGWNVRVLVRPGIVSFLHAAGSDSVVLVHGTPRLVLAAAIARWLRPFQLVVRIGGDFFWERAVEGGKFFGTLRDFYIKGGARNPRHWLLAGLVGFAYRQANALVFTSAFLRDIYIPFYRLNEKKIHLIAHPVPSLITQPAQDTTPVAPGARLVYAGRFLTLKNLEMLLEVFTEARKTHPNITLTLIGGGPESVKLKAQSEKLGIQNCVVFKKPVSHDEALSEISTSDLVVLPSLSEVSPNLFFDALAAATPVLATQENGYREIFQGIFTFFNPMDRTDFLAKLNTLLAPGALERMRERLGTFRYDRTWADAASDYEEILNLHGE